MSLVFEMASATVKQHNGKRTRTKERRALNFLLFVVAFESDLFYCVR